MANKNILDNGRLSQKFNIPIPYTQTTPPNTSTFSFTANPTGNIVYSLALNYDTSNTQPNYSFLITVSGLNIDNGDPNQNEYTLLPASGGYNPIPEGVGIKIPPNSKITINAYMSGSTTTNGSFSVSILSEVL